MRSKLLCVGLRYASALHHAQSPPAEIADLINTSIVRLLRCQGVLTGEGRPVTSRNLWNVLRKVDASMTLRVQRHIRDNVIYGAAPWGREEWAEFSVDLLTALGIDGEPTEACMDFLRFVPYNEGEELAQNIGQRSNVIFEHDGVHVRLGSINSVKGKTVDAILALETEVYRGRALADRTMDLATVLPHAFGLEERDFSASQVELAAATNIFVATTRPRHFLALAMRRQVASDILIAAAEESGWIVRDLTNAVPQQM